MAETPKYTIGQWLRWHQLEGCRIGVVQYVRELGQYPWGFEYVTDNGIVREREILEAR